MILPITNNAGKGWKMENTIKKFFKIKSEGDQFVEASICILATLICSVCIMLCFSVWMTQYSANDSLNLIQTSYIKKMETTGYWFAEIYFIH